MLGKNRRRRRCVLGFGPGERERLGGWEGAWGWGSPGSGAGGLRAACVSLPPPPPPPSSWGWTLGHAGDALPGNGDAAAGSPLGASGDGCAHQWPFVFLLLRSGARPGVSAAVLRLTEAEPPPSLPCPPGWGCHRAEAFGTQCSTLPSPHCPPRHPKATSSSPQHPLMPTL